jgi:uncharacterized surface protein with fasciclin (FAS1) repeats
MKAIQTRLTSWLALAVTALGVFTPVTYSHANWSWWKRPRPEPNLVQKLEQSGHYTTLLTALELTELKDTVAQAEALTIFAPTDAAFAALPEGTLEALVNDLPALKNILLYHVLAGKLSSRDLLSASTATTLQGNPVLVTHENWRPVVNGVAIHPANLRASNGYIHSIGQVLLPPAENIEINSLLDVLKLDGRFTILLAALEATGLDDAVATSPALTIFAPTDDAFNSLPEGTIPALLNDLPTLTNILLYHVLGEKADAVQLLKAGHAETLQGDNVAFKFDRWKILVNESTLITPNVNGPNGYLQVIDAVLLPPAKATTLLDLLKNDGRFTTLVAALEATGLDAALTGVDPLTIFAPTDEAFSKLPAGTVEGLLNDVDALSNILLYHVVSGDRDLPDLASDRSVETLNGQNVHVWNWGRYYFVNRSYVIEQDLLADNGRVHAINRVLLPPQ